LAVAAAEDEEVLLAVRQAQDEKIAEGILVGDQSKIKSIAEEHKISLDGFEIINEPDQMAAAFKCCELIHQGRAAAIMKGLIDTSKIFKAILNKELGLNTGNLLSHVAVFELETYPKLLFLTDGAINIAPTLKEKAIMISNAVQVARSLGVEKPLVACCAAVEKVNAEGMSATVDAALLAKMCDRGQIANCIVDGPLGLDNAISEESARIKKINSPVAGKADILLFNDIESANFTYKTIVQLCKAGKVGNLIGGSKAPMVISSRADSHEVKYLSIVLAMLTSSASTN
jgi:phosphate butyryltransferase